MNLLLLLSALLSALTGVGGSVRAPDVAQVAAGQAATVRAAVAQRRATATARPVAGLPALAALASGARVVALPVAAGAPIWAGRRRE